MGDCTPSLKSGIGCILLQLKEGFKGFTMPRFICPHCHSPVDPASMDFATGPGAYYRVCPVCDEAVLVALAAGLHAAEPEPAAHDAPEPELAR